MKLVPQFGRRGLRRTLREAAKVASTALMPDRPLLVHIIPMRRCNLACAYCNEYDDHSDPVPTDVMFRRIDRLAEFGTAVITISGGEPLLHPDLDKILRYIHDKGIVVTLITNGYNLMPERIKALNETGLDRLQISIDNVQPDEVSQKSLKVLDKKLRYLAEFADFEININSVIGGNVDRPDDALVISKRAIELGFTSTMGVIHEGHGKLVPLAGRDKEVFDEYHGMERLSLTRFNRTFQTNLANGKTNEWRCRAGSRYLYICEDGLVHYCSQQRGYPGVPLEEYTIEDIRREHLTEKYCAPFCTVSCVHQASAFDRFRAPQTAGKFNEPQAGGATRLVTLTTKKIKKKDAVSA